MRAPADEIVTVRPSKRATVRPSTFASRSGNVARHEIDERRFGRERLAVGERPAVGDGLGGERDVALPPLGERSRPCRQIRRDLLRHRLVRFGGRVASDRDRMRGAHMRARRHRGHVGGHHDEEARRCGTCAAGSDEHSDRRPRGEHPRDDGLG